MIIKKNKIKKKRKERCLKGPDLFHRANKKDKFELRGNTLITGLAHYKGYWEM